MNQKELTKSFMMLSIGKKTLSSRDLCKKYHSVVRVKVLGGNIVRLQDVTSTQ